MSEPEPEQTTEITPLTRGRSQQSVRSQSPAAGVAHNSKSRERKAVQKDAIFQWRKRFTHLKRVSQGLSSLHLHPISTKENFPEVFEEFEEFYTKNELLKLERIFLSLDHDKDNYFNQTEIRYFMEKNAGSPISKQELREILRIADEDRDGLLSFREFLLLCKQVQVNEDTEKRDEKMIEKEVLEIAENALTISDEDLQEHSERNENEKFKSSKLGAKIQESIKFFEKLILPQTTGTGNEKESSESDNVPEETVIIENSTEPENTEQNESSTTLEIEPKSGITAESSTTPENKPKDLAAESSTTLENEPKKLESLSESSAALENEPKDLEIPAESSTTPQNEPKEDLAAESSTTPENEPKKLESLSESSAALENKGSESEILQESSTTLKIEPKEFESEISAESTPENEPKADLEIEAESSTISENGPKEDLEIEVGAGGKSETESKHPEFKLNPETETNLPEELKEKAEYSEEVAEEFEEAEEYEEAEEAEEYEEAEELFESVS